MNANSHFHIARPRTSQTSGSRIFFPADLFLFARSLIFLMLLPSGAISASDVPSSKALSAEVSLTSWSAAFTENAQENKKEGMEAAEEEKLCLAHYVAWGFDHAGRYDQWSRNPQSSLHPLTDRTLLGRDLQWDSGVGEAVRKQIDTARLYGIDGFVVDVVRTASFTSTMSRFFRAAEGTDFKIVLCIDNYAQAPASELIDALSRFVRTYRNHPNAWLKDGRLVVFAYDPGIPASEWGKVAQVLNSDPETAICFLPRLIREGRIHEDPEELRAWLAVCDGIYDFGCNGFFLSEMEKRLQEAQNALSAHCPGGILAAGVAPGYLGLANGFYRPFLNTQSMRDNWTAAIRSGAPYVCLTTWNDYAEHTHFEPSVHNRTALLRLNQEFVRIWRGIKPPKRPAEVLISFQEEVLDGSDWTLEVLNFSYTTEPETVLLRFLKEDGTLLKMQAVPLKKENLTAQTLRFCDEEMKDWRLVRIQAVKCRSNEAEMALPRLQKGEDVPELTFRELPPLVRRCGHIETPRTTRIVWSELSRIPAELRLDGEKAILRLKAWTAAGKLELIRNGWPVWEEQISHLKAPVFQREINLPPARSPWDVYLVRFTNVSDGPSWSNPVSRFAGVSNETVRRRVFQTGSTFDEEWGWSRSRSRFTSPRLEEREVPAWSVFALDFPLDGPQKDTLNGMQENTLKDPGNTKNAEQARTEFVFSRTSWYLPLKIRGGRWIEDSGRTVLEFDGQTTAEFQSRTFPTETFTLELEIFPQNMKREMVLFHDPCGFRLTLDAEGHAVLQNRKRKLRSDEPAAFGEWNRLRVVFEGRTLRLFMNGKLAAESETPAVRMLINSVPKLGDDGSEGLRFVGKMKNFRIF